MKKDTMDMDIYELRELERNSVKGDGGVQMTVHNIALALERAGINAFDDIAERIIGETGPDEIEYAAMLTQFVTNCIKYEKSELEF